MISQVCRLLSVATCIKTLLMSVLPGGGCLLPVVQVQVLGSSVHCPLENTLSPPELNASIKWKVVFGFKGAPLASRTPAPLTLGSQSPLAKPAVPATSSPPIPNPPAGTVTGATPVGGGTACVINGNRATTSAAPRADLVRFIKWTFVERVERGRVSAAGRQMLSPLTFRFELPVFIRFLLLE